MEPRVSWGLHAVRGQWEWRGTEPVSHWQATCNMGGVRADSVVPACRESFLARTQRPAMLAALQTTADSNLKHQRSPSVLWERKNAEGRGNLVERILLLHHFISMLNRKQM